MNRFLYFSRGQQIAIITLVVLVVLAFVANWSLPHLLPTNADESDSAYLAQVAAFEQSLSDRPVPAWQSPFEAKPRYEERHLAAKLFDFDPNTLDSTDFVRLGFKDWLIGKIMNYRRSGKEFYTADFFLKYCRFPDDDAARLLPHVQIPPKEKPQFAQTDTVARQPKKEFVHIELNSADTTELQRMPGIGSGRAKQIVALRRQLGGFVEAKQLFEVKNFPPDLFDKMAPYLSVDRSKVEKIAVNRAKVDRLKRHPYINFYQAKAIYELRIGKPNRQLNAIDELRGLPEFSETDLQRIEPYLNFDEVKYEYKKR